MAVCVCVVTLYLLQTAELATLSASAACILGDWQLLEKHTDLIPHNTMDGAQQVG